MKPTIIDNFLPEDKFAPLEHFLLKDGLCPWYYNPFIVADEQKENGFQFTHTFLRGRDNYISPHVSKIDDLIEAIAPTSIFKIKANLGGRTQVHEEGGFHTDFGFECKTAVFYINTNNGFTLFKNGMRVDSVRNRLVVFNSQIEHTGVSQTDTKVRCLLNLNYE